MKRGLFVRKNGFNVIEMLVAVAILIVIIAFSVRAFTNTREPKIFDSQELLIESQLNEVRTNAVNNKNAIEHGIHFSSSAIIIFEGTSYSVSDPDNVVIELDEEVEISDISLSGGSEYVVFSKLTGKALQTGSITLSLISDPTAYSTDFVVEGTGVINVN